MIPIKHILNEIGVKEIFKLIVPSGSFQGKYEIQKPTGWDEVDSIVDINDEFFNVSNFIIGDKTKLSFNEYSDIVGFSAVKNVYEEQLGDGVIHFKWIAVKNNVEYDLLKDNFDVNLNVYSEVFDGSMRKIEVEIIKSEAQNLMETREDTTIDLFEDKDLDENPIVPVPVFAIGYKKGDKILSNFYSFDISQYILGAATAHYKDQFFSFVRADDYEFGDNTNKFVSWQNYGPGVRKYQGPFFSTSIMLKNVKIEISNLNIGVETVNHTFPQAALYAVLKSGETVMDRIELKKATQLPVNGGVVGEIKIENETFPIGNVGSGQKLDLEISSGENIAIFPIKTITTIEITSNMESPLVKTKGIRLLDCINQIAKNYSSGVLTAESNILGPGGSFYNTSISTGMYLRGLPEIFLSQKLKTSLSSLFYNGASKLLALGYDILGNKMIVENIDYFFKDIKSYDLTDKIYLQEGYSLQNDKDLAFNQLTFGSKKYSTNVKFDVKNFNTVSELSTPIKSNKGKFDKQTDLIIDTFRIQEMIEDKSSSTNDNDDDIVLIDMVETSDIWDLGVFENCAHSNESGSLLLNCVETPFDTTLIEVGNLIRITEGINSGNWTVLSIEGSRMKLSGSSSIQTGVADTPIKYKVSTLIKNRTTEGFEVDENTIWNAQTTTNIRHNPKYQLARWFAFFGAGLSRKKGIEKLKTTNYKNNSEAKIKIVPTVSPDMINELPGEIVVGADEELNRLREFKEPLFNGKKIEISYDNVTFQEFFSLYGTWRFGEGDDRNKSRGYLELNTPEGLMDVYPFGDGALSHDRKTNRLSIKGKVKGKSVNSPELLSAVQIDRTTLSFVWEYGPDYINPLIKIQYSPDGVSWITVKEVQNVKSATVQDDLFNQFMTGDQVYFRILISTDDFSKKSNTKTVSWQFNDWSLKEITRTENVNCGYSYLTFEISGNANLEFTWMFSSYPGGGNASVIYTDDNTGIVSFTSAAGSDYDETKISTLNLDGTKSISIQIKNSNQAIDYTYLNCNSGDMIAFVSAVLQVTVKNLSTLEERELLIGADTAKKYKSLGPVIDPGT